MPFIFSFNCPTCDREIKRVSSDFIGKRANCKGCGAQLTVPDPQRMKVGVDPSSVEIDYSEETEKPESMELESQKENQPDSVLILPPITAPAHRSRGSIVVLCGLLMLAASLVFQVAILVELKSDSIENKMQRVIDRDNVVKRTLADIDEEHKANLERMRKTKQAHEEYERIFGRK